MTTQSVTVEPFLLTLTRSPDPLREGVQRFSVSVIPTATLPLTFTWQAAGSSVEIH